MTQFFTEIENLPIYMGSKRQPTQGSSAPIGTTHEK